MNTWDSMSLSIERNVGLLHVPLKDLQQIVVGDVPQELVKYLLSVDLYVDNYHFVVSYDGQMMKCSSTRRFDVKTIQKSSFEVKYNPTEKCYQLELPILPPGAELLQQDDDDDECESMLAVPSSPGLHIIPPAPIRPLRLWKLCRITDQCSIRLDERDEPRPFESYYRYGFASSFKGRALVRNCDIGTIARIPDPGRSSIVARGIKQQLDEINNFSPDEYAAHLKFKVPAGAGDPMMYVNSFSQYKLTKGQRFLLKKLTKRKIYKHPLPENHMDKEVGYGLASLVLAICYDVRITANSPNSQSAHTRSVLSPLLMYFATMTNFKAMLVAFFRRALVFTEYHNFELARLCVRDAISALEAYPLWILKQLLITHRLFRDNEPSLKAFNVYYIEHYIRLVYSDDMESSDESPYTVLAMNMRNSYRDICNTGLQRFYETEIVKKLFEELRFDVKSPEDLDDYEEEVEEEEPPVEEYAAIQYFDEDNDEFDSSEENNPDPYADPLDIYYDDAM